MFSLLQSCYASIFPSHLCRYLALLLIPWPFNRLSYSKQDWLFASISLVRAAHSFFLSILFCSIASIIITPSHFSTIEITKHTVYILLLLSKSPKHAACIHKYHRSRGSSGHHSKSGLAQRRLQPRRHHRHRNSHRISAAFGSLNRHLITSIRKNSTTGNAKKLRK